MKNFRIILVSIIFTLAFTSCTDLDDDSVEASAIENIQATGDISQDNGNRP